MGKKDPLKSLQGPLLRAIANGTITSVKFPGLALSITKRQRYSKEEQAQTHGTNQSFN